MCAAQEYVVTAQGVIVYSTLSCDLSDNI